MSARPSSAAVRRVTLALLVLVVVALPSAAWSVGPTNVSGTISSNTTWALADSPFVMTGNVTVASGVTLTIAPGVVVKGNSTTRSLTVNGALSAVGTAAAPITFTSSSDSAPGQWGRLRFPAGSGTSVLEHVNVRYGGGGGGNHTNGMIEVDGGTITLENATVKDSLTRAWR